MERLKVIEERRDKGNIMQLFSIRIEKKTN